MEISQGFFEIWATTMPGVMLFVLVIQMKYVVDIMITSIQILFLEQDCELFFYFLIVIVSCFFFIFRTKTPIDGVWTEWSDWGTCDTNCLKSRTRSCNNPPPFAGGLDCVGNTTEFLPCCGGDCWGRSKYFRIIWYR